MHGDKDDKILLSWGQQAKNLVRGYANNLEFKTFKEVGHDVSEEQMEEIASFCRVVLT